MNSHEPDARDPVDKLIGRALKGWVSGYPAPAPVVRQRLIDGAAQARRKSDSTDWVRSALGFIQSVISPRPVFDPEYRASSAESLSYSNIRMMHVSVLHVNTLRLGMFSMFV